MSLRRRQRRVALVAWVLWLATASACVYPSRAWVPVESRACEASSETSFGRRLSEAAAAHPGSSAVYPLASGLDALAARLALIEGAERAIDFQYYILHRDATGEFVVARLLAAADRGVRVRMLVDDLGSSDLDGWLPALAAHPSVEVRYFNPFARGPWQGLARSLDSVARLRRINHRMHNKPSGAAVEEAHESGLFGSSGASLHAKSFLYDRKRIFVGSLNLDPRSVDLNTELGVVVECEPLAAESAARFEYGISSELSWRLSLDGDGELVWDSSEDGQPLRCTSEPEVGWWRRFAVWCQGWLPIESQL